MINKAKYTFKIDKFTPETMPFGRLLEYYAELKKMIGFSEHLHLVEIFESSHGTCLAVDQVCDHKMQERMLLIRGGNAPKIAMRARDQINQMLREDGTSGEFADSNGRNVIPFPGRTADENTIYSIQDQVELNGELYYIAGSSSSDVKARIQTENFGVIYCRATREMGIELRDYLFEQVKIKGRGLWRRTSDGAWGVNDVVISDFAPISNDSLRTTINKIRALDIDWPDDVLAEIDQMEERGGQVH